MLETAIVFHFPMERKFTRRTRPPVTVWHERHAEEDFLALVRREKEREGGRRREKEGERGRKREKEGERGRKREKEGERGRKREREKERLNH